VPIDAKHQRLELTSPRSVEACLHLGIEPADLIFRNLDYFIKQENNEVDLAALAYDFHEGTRQVTDTNELQNALKLSRIPPLDLA
jgi:hypothetical protein